MTDAPIKHVEISHDRWKSIYQSLVEEHGASINISWVMRRKCGFTVREHQGWDNNTNRYKYKMFLDFYDEQYKTLFFLKYGIE